MSRYHERTGRRRMPKVITVIVVVLLVALVVTVGLIRQNYYENLKPVSSSQQSKLVTVESGSTAAQIAAQLKEAGLIKQTWAFEWYVRNHNLRNKLLAGSYYIQPSQDVAQIVDVLTKGKVATDLFTILPGKRIDQIKASMVNAGFIPADVEEAFNPDLYKDHPALVDKPAGASLEGYLYPESFQKQPDTKPSTIVTASLDEMQKRLTPDIRAAFTRQNLTVHQGVILASIVEQEVSNGSDRPMVAQVFLKRMKDGMQLGSDVTAFYGAIIAGKTPTVFYDSPYNTRLYDGLTPGPISNVSGSSLQAIANPAATDYVYFVAGDDGKTYFSHTLSEHEALTKAHCKKLCE